MGLATLLTEDEYEDLSRRLQEGGGQTASWVIPERLRRAPEERIALFRREGGALEMFAVATATDADSEGYVRQLVASISLSEIERVGISTRTLLDGLRGEHAQAEIDLRGLIASYPLAFGNRYPRPLVAGGTEPSLLEKLIESWRLGQELKVAYFDIEALPAYDFSRHDSPSTSEPWEFGIVTVS